MKRATHIMISAVLILIIGAAINIAVAWAHPLLDQEARASRTQLMSVIDAVGRPEVVLLVEEGFPLPALWCMYQKPPTGDPWEDGIRIADEFILPIRPLHPGFTLNTILYAALTAAVWYGAAAIRRAHVRRNRRRRDQCPHCAYLRTGLATNAPCPECGSAAGATS